VWSSLSKANDAAVSDEPGSCFVLVSYIDDARSGSRTSLNLCFSGLTGASISAPAAASPISWSPFADMFWRFELVRQIIGIDWVALLQIWISKF